MLTCGVHKAGTAALAEIHWEGDSREILASFPEEVRGSFGFALYQLQIGREPSMPTRRMQSIGAGVYELKESDQKSWYRVIYLSRIDDVIYVLHCFEKQSRKTHGRDLELAKKRLSRVRQRRQEQRKNAKGIKQF